ncbi:hypothetical protein DSO57_1011745 [Entomophthora muscae]|uniref:Uncharacterized protein n=2 Tax=Entomophthora muscae TaxID=34485 RepID=A0ACC2U3X4_9FUNG|nr:hypothetical protein DSO57_1011743 [Entomophthora muscae]KAJ9081715.1 hypothetical protein DSO57_1011745 [Entomophthora muscae]
MKTISAVLFSLLTFTIHAIPASEGTLARSSPIQRRTHGHVKHGKGHGGHDSGISVVHAKSKSKLKLKEDRHGIEVKAKNKEKFKEIRI